MIAQMITINPQLFIDIADVSIPHWESCLKIHAEKKAKRSRNRFSEMKTGKFRKLFDRHTLAYKH